MKISSSFILHEFDGQTVIVPTAKADFHGLVQGNKTLAAIYDCLKRETTEQEIVDTLCARYDGDINDITADVREAIEQLRQIGAINE